MHFLLLMNLPQQLQQDAAQFAQQQGISLEQFVLWAVTEKVGALKQQANLRDFPEIAIRSGASGIPTPVIKGTNIRVQTIAIANIWWQQPPSMIANEYDLTETQVQKALAFYEAHRTEIDAAIAAEQALEPAAHV
jgi:uncharacterized protein (DUF433 family)